VRGEESQADIPSMRGRLFGEGAFSLGPGDCGRWPFKSMLEPSRCICAVIMPGFFICMFAMGLPFLWVSAGRSGGA
jgi:hypothetical protein